MSQGVRQTAIDLRMYKAYLAIKPTSLTPPVTYGNATTTRPYKGNGMGTSRSDANDNFKHASVDMCAQIVRCV